MGLIVWFEQIRSNGERRASDNALAVLKKRYAKGEITEEEFG